MKILQLFGGLIRRGGEEMFVLNCLRNLNMPDSQIDCLVIEDCDNDEFRDFVNSRGGSVFELNIPLHATCFINHVYRPVIDFFKTHSYDIIHIHSSSIPALAVLAAAAKRSGTKKVIVHSHATGESDSIQHKLFRYLASLSMRGNVDIYCACSKAAAEWKFAPKYAERAVIIKNGIDTNRFTYNQNSGKAVRDKLNIPHDAFVICNVGRLCAVKNQEFILKVFELIASSDAYLLLIGDGEDKDKLVKSVSEKGLSEKVVFTGNVTDVEKYLCAADVFVMPSKNEGLGIAAVEAQCTGLSVVASVGVPEEIKLTEDVRFLSIEDNKPVYNEWAETIESFRSRPRTDNSEIIRKNGYDIRSTAEQLIRLYTS